MQERLVNQCPVCQSFITSGVARQGVDCYFSMGPQATTHVARIDIACKSLVSVRVTSMRIGMDEQMRLGDLPASVFRTLDFRGVQPVLAGQNVTLILVSDIHQEVSVTIHFGKKH